MSKKQGFALLSPEDRRRVSSLGGRVGQATRKSRRWTKEEASAAGTKGAASKKRKQEARKGEDVQPD